MVINGRVPSYSIAVRSRREESPPRDKIRQYSLNSRCRLSMVVEAHVGVLRS